MHIVAQRTPLLEACKLAEKAVVARPVNPALSNLLLDAGPDGCFLTGAGPAAAVRLPFAAAVEQPGRALVPARQFLGILREARDDELILRAQTDRVWVRGNDAEFELRSDDVSRFPLLPSWQDGPCDAFAPEPLRQTVERTLFAVGKESSGHSVRGVLWEIEGDRLRLVATDNRRLAVAEMPARSEGLRLREVVVPVEAMQLLQRMPAAPDGAVEAVFRLHEVLFRSAGAVLCAPLRSGPFPPWRKALALEPRYRLLLPVGPFLAGVRQAAVLRDRTANRLMLRFQGGRVTLRSRQPGTGRACVQQALALPCPREPVEVAFNPTYLTELLGVLDAAATVQLELRDADAPALFRSADGYRHVLMPLRRE